jgi:hypothetical protein
MGGVCSTNGGEEECIQDIGGKGKRPLGRPRCRWVDNIKIDLREIRWDDMDWTDLAHHRDQWRVFVNMVMKLQVS